MEQSFIVRNDFILHLLLDLCSQHQSIVLELVSVKFHQGFSQDCHDFLGDLKFLLVDEEVKLLFVLRELGLGGVDVQSDNLVILSDLELLLQLLSLNDLCKCETFVLHQIVNKPIVKVFP